MRPVDDKFVIDDDTDSDTATESNLSLRALSFLNRVNDRLRKMLDRCRRCNARHRHTFYNLGMFVSSTLEASVLIGKNNSDNLHSIKNTGKNLTLKQMLDISEKLRIEHSGEIFGVSQISWVDSPWTQLSLVSDESLACKRFTYSQILCYVLER